jgi:hypothetical protein
MSHSHPSKTGLTDRDYDARDAQERRAVERALAAQREREDRRARHAHLSRIGMATAPRDGRGQPRG